MKINKISKLLTAVLLFAGLCLTSCSTKWQYYDPANDDVSFNTDGAVVSFTGTPIVVTVQRGNADKALTVPLKLTDTSGAFSLTASSVDFAVGEYTKTVNVTYSTASLIPANDYRLTVSLSDNTMAGDGSFNTYGIVGTLPLVFKPYGTINFVQGLLLDDASNADFKTSYDLYKADYTTNYYVIKKIFGSTTDLEIKVSSTGAEVLSPAPVASGWFSSKMIVIVTGAIDPYGFEKPMWLQFNAKSGVLVARLATSGNLLAVNSIVAINGFLSLDDDNYYDTDANGKYWTLQYLVVSAVK